MNKCEERIIRWNINIVLHSYEGEANENFKNDIKIQNRARFYLSWQQWYSWFEKWPTDDSTMQERNKTAQ